MSICSFALFNASTRSSRLRPNRALSTSSRAISLVGVSWPRLRPSPSDCTLLLGATTSSSTLVAAAKEGLPSARGDAEDTLREALPRRLPGGAGLAMAAVPLASIMVTGVCPNVAAGPCWSHEGAALSHVRQAIPGPRISHPFCIACRARAPLFSDARRCGQVFAE